MADITASLGLKVTADTTDVVSAFTKAEQAGAKVGDTVEKKVGAGIKQATAEASKLTKEVEKTESVMKTLGKGLQVFNQAMGAIGTVGRIADAALELAKFSGEMRRLEAAIPVERLRQLQEETKGTVDKMTLLQRAAKEMGLSATEGMDEQALALKRGLADWSNFVDQAKASIGGLISTAIVGIVDLSNAIGNAISGEEQLRRTAGLAAENAAERARQAKNWAAFDAAKAPELNARTKQYFEQEAASTLGIGKVFPKGVDAFVKGYKPPRRGGGRSSARSYDVGGGADFLTGGVGGGAEAQNDERSRMLGELGGFDTPDLLARSRSNLGAIGEAAIGGGSGGGLDALKKQQDDLQRMTDVVKGTFDVFGSAIGAAVSAAITGSEGAAAAAKKALKIKLQAIATESVVMAAFEGAMALGSLAVGDAKGAATHGASAAKFLVTAALAGAGSAAMGNGGGGASAGQGGASGAPGGGFTPSLGASGSSVREQTINVHLHGVLAGNERDLSRQIRRGIAYGEAAGLSQPGNDNITGRVE